jgi:hypothetical protein
MKTNHLAGDLILKREGDAAGGDEVTMTKYRRDDFKSSERE